MFPELAEVTSLLLERKGTIDIQVEVGIQKGLPLFQILGGASPQMKESRERIKLALEACGFVFPMETIVINLRPAHLLKKNAFLDLPIALGILQATGQWISPLPKQTIILGSLHLSGRLSGKRELLPLLWLRKTNPDDFFLLPKELEKESLPQANYLFLDSLREILEQNPVLPRQPTLLSNPPSFFPNEKEENWKEASLTSAQMKVFQGMCYSILGRHHCLTLGNPGQGKTMLAKLASHLQPPWTEKESSSLYSEQPWLSWEQLGKTLPPRPFRSPHHTTTDLALVGGGSPVRWGEVSLAHKGILFLDELTEFKEKALEALREPMEEKKVVISRVLDREILPADFVLLGACNPCPCGHFKGNKRCRCSLEKIRNYLRKLTGPFLDRITIVSFLFENSEKRNTFVQEKEYRKKMNRAKEFREIRIEKEIEDSRSTDPELFLSSQYLKDIGKKFSFRKRKQLVELARTIADWENSEITKEEHYLEAFDYLQNSLWFEDFESII
ncbi:ATP-binding protein [Leptospira idonii]|uniref:ATP-binding protein n=1 Tax=Leptospira idonii TaxID=1193500 RepID=A0A4R9LYU3_9LEPT|nr:ATP-binding protein [Leptospira idonii]TGN18537.1 ATP-binding protein [Leptospira idonii]